MKFKVLSFFAVLCFFTMPASAAEDGWTEFSLVCSSEMLPDWPAQVEKGKAWTPKSADNLEGLREMARKICPDYLAHRNDGVAIRQFTEKKREIVDVSPFIERDGNALLEFLQTQLALQQAAFAPAELDFSATRCGQHMRATGLRMKARLLQIRETASSLAAKCFRLNDKADAEAQAAGLKKADEKARNSGALQPTETRAKKASSITGVEQDKAKRSK